MGGFRRTIQIIWTLLCLLTLIAVAGLVYPIPYVTPFVHEYLMGNETIQIIILVLLATIFIYFLVFFFWSCFAPSKHSRLDITDERGTVRIQRQAVESVALAAVDAMHGVYQPEVTVDLYNRPEDTVVDATIYVTGERNLEQMGSEAKTRINDALRRTLGFEPKRTNVKIQRAEFTQTKEARTKKKAPRVR